MSGGLRLSDTIGPFSTFRHEAAYFDFYVLFHLQDVYFPAYLMACF